MTGKADPALVELLARRIEAWRSPDRMFVLGICGAQGSGKSTLVTSLAARLADAGLKTACLSLDDLYLTRAERLRMADRIHPLFATRGVPGTHDTDLGLETIAALQRGEAAAMPRFDKGADDRVAPVNWPRAPAGCAVLLFEGWCLGAAPQDTAALAEPVNALEVGEDPEGIWRGQVNAALAGPYQALWRRIDRLVLLAAPDWEIVARWREEQEEQLRASGAERAMSPPQVLRFIQHYERLTRHVLAEMPGRADLVLRLGADRSVIANPG